MRRRGATIGRYAVVLVLAAASMSCRSKRPPPKVLVFSATAGFRHGSIAAGIAAVRAMGREHGFDVDATENPAWLVEERLRQYAAVLFLNTTGDVLARAQEADFERYIQAGGGFVGIHAAADTEPDWAWYGRLVGARFDTHPPGVHAASVDVVDTRLPGAADLPPRFQHTDEWYNFKDLAADTTVLLAVDEKTYQGGSMGARHPVSWYREHDGGRSFYTALGHTDEAFAQPPVRTHLLSGIRYAIGERRALDYGRAKTRRVPEGDRFVERVLVQGLFEPTEMAILPTLDVLIAQRRGEILFYDSALETAFPVAALPVYWESKIPGVNVEEGLMGIAVDPDFATNHHVYVYYARAAAPVNRLARFTFENRRLDLASETTILEVPTDRDMCCHTGGSITFGPDRLLYLSTGDNTWPFDEPGQRHVTRGFAPLDDRKGHARYDSRRTAGNTNDLRGKVLRIRVNDTGGYDIPPGNLFPPGTPRTRPEVYVMGARNPYRISVDAKTGWLYFGDNGPDAKEDDPARGPLGLDEVNQVRRASNYGYPFFLGQNTPYRAFDYATGKSGPPFDPGAPINESRNNTGLRELPPAMPALIWYPYGASDRFPQVGSGARSIMAGPVYHSDRHSPATRLPDYYDGKLFIYDWMRGWIMAVTLGGDGHYEGMERFMPASKWSGPIDVELGPDGRLYVLEYGSGWFSKSPDAALSRVEYRSGNRPPVARLALDRTSGAVPFRVTANARGSSDPDGDRLTYRWTFGQKRVETTEPTAAYTFDRVGESPISLEIIDAHGATARSEVVPVYAGNHAPELAIRVDGNSMFYLPGRPVSYSVSVADREEGTLESGRIDASALRVVARYRVGRRKGAAPGLDASVASGDGSYGRKLMEGSDCRSCHRTDEQSAGPTFKRIAERYGSNREARPYLARKIIAGSSGVWGQVPMAAHPAISEPDAAAIADWILSLAGRSADTIALPARGSIDPKPLTAAGAGDMLVIEASYTDRGGPGVRRLAGSARALLYAPIIQAEDYDQAESVSGYEYAGTGYLIPAPPAWAAFHDLDLIGVRGIELVFAMRKGPDYGYVITVHLDGPEGTVLGTGTIADGVAPHVENRARIRLTPVTDGKRHALHIVFRASDPREKIPLGLDAFQLLSE